MYLSLTYIISFLGFLVKLKLATVNFLFWLQAARFTVAAVFYAFNLSRPIDRKN